MDYIAKFKDRLDDLAKNLADLNFDACSNISTDFIRTSEFIVYPEGVFIGEFFESLFDNIKGVYENFKVKEDEDGPLRNEIARLLKLIKESIPTTDENIRADLYGKMVEVRYMVTKFQIKYYREGKRKGRRLPERVVIPEDQ